MLVFSIFLSVLVSPDGGWSGLGEVIGRERGEWGFGGLSFVEFSGWGRIPREGGEGGGGGATVTLLPVG